MQDWIIPIHDAFIINPCDAYSVKTQYAEEITAIYYRRKEILSNYFASIGIDSKSATAWKEVKDRIQPIGVFKCKTTALK